MIPDSCHITKSNMYINNKQYGSDKTIKDFAIRYRISLMFRSKFSQNNEKFT